MNTTPHILVVDDEIEIAQLVATLLSQEGMNVYACYSGEEALTTLPMQIQLWSMYDT